jgi:hypothetical protein
MPPPIRRLESRPLAGSLIEALQASCEEIAKGWLLAMIEDAPFADAAALLGGPLVRDGVGLCAAVIGALGSDAELARLEAVSSLSVDACGALRRVLWAAIVAEVSSAGESPGVVAARIAGCAERLGIVFDAVLRASVVARDPVAAAGAWPRALEAAIAASAGPLSLIAVILDDAERILGVETRADAAAIWEALRRVLTAAVARDGTVICEAPGPAWIVCDGASRLLAQRVAERIAAGVAEVRWRGAPVGVSAGIAVLGDDGDTATALLDAAESAALAAAARGIEISS